MNTPHEFARQTLNIPIGAKALPGILSVPAAPVGIVLFAHGSGSSRLSVRNQYVANFLHERGLATLLFDLLTEREAEVRDKVFDVELLAERLEDATIWQQEHRDLHELRAGYFGASTGAAAALIAAARMPGTVGAVVSRGGRPDLAMTVLPLVTAATLLIVGGDDREVLHLNRESLKKLCCTKELAIVPHATHLFSEPGALQRAAELAADWFLEHLGHEQQARRCAAPQSDAAGGWTDAAS